MFWLIAGAGPMAWMLEMAINLSFSYPACANDRRWQLILFAVLAGALAVAGTVAASRQRRNVVGDLASHQFKATVAMVLNGIFALLILAQALVVVLTRGCA